MEDWTDKYRPQSLSDLVGNEKAITKLKTWSHLWKQGKKPVKPGIILSGKPGIGKTSCAYALANDLNWIPIELNASDSRNATKIKKIATSGALHDTFDITGNYLSSKQGGRKLIILDEADNLYEKTSKTDGKDYSDHGGKKAIIDTLKKTNQPIILIVNDYYNLIRGSGEAFKRLCINAAFTEVSTHLIVDVLKRICREEQLTIDIKILTTLAERCKGDVRSAVNDLQALSINSKQIDVSSLDVLGYRDREKIIFDALRDIFKSQNLTKIHNITRNLDVSPDMLLLWIAENIPREYQNPKDRANALDFAAKADVFFGRVFRRQHYGYWSYANDLMTSGVSAAKTQFSGNMRYYPPSWFKYRKGYRQSSGPKIIISKKLAEMYHCSIKKIEDNLFQDFQAMFRNNIRLASLMVNKLDLTEPEIRYILGSEHEILLKDILDYSDKDTIIQQDIISSDEKTLDESSEESSESHKKAQQRLF